jgi:hypothetical protein
MVGLLAYWDDGCLSEREKNFSSQKFASEAGI